MALKPTLPKLYTVIVDFKDIDKNELRYGVCFAKDGISPFITDDWQTAKEHVDYLNNKVGYVHYFICELTHAPIRNQNRNNG